MNTTPYTFYKHDGVHTAPDFEVRFCCDDADARTQALNLLSAFKEYERIEIWRDLREPFTVARSALGPNLRLVVRHQREAAPFCTNIAASASASQPAASPPGS